MWVTLVYTLVDYQRSWPNQPQQVLSACHISHLSVPFTISITVDRDMEVVTGLPLKEATYLAGGLGKKFVFFSPSARDIFLLAAPYKTVKKPTPEEAMITYCANGHEDNAHYITTRVKDRITFYEQLIPLTDKQSLSLVEIPPFFLNSWMGETAERRRLGLNHVVLISEYYFLSLPRENTSDTKLQSLYFDESVLSLWWPGFDTSDPGNISAGMLSYMHTLYQENTLGREYYDDVKEFWLQYKPVPSLGRDRSHAGGETLVVKEIFLMLDDIRQSELGSEGVKSFLQKVYALSANTHSQRNLSGGIYFTLWMNSPRSFYNKAIPCNRSTGSWPNHGKRQNI